MEVCYKAARELSDFFVAVTNTDWDRVEEHRVSIVALENEADEIKAQLRSQLPKSMFMPVAREDLLELTFDGAVIHVYYLFVSSLINILQSFWHIL